MITWKLKDETPPHMLRVVDEARELVERIRKAKDFVYSNKFEGKNPRIREACDVLINKQIPAMEQYLFALFERILPYIEEQRWQYGPREDDPRGV